MAVALVPHIVQTSLHVHREISSRVLDGSRSEAFSVDDRRKRQTFTATPAEPGDLPWEVSAAGAQRLHPDRG
jgi:hypothetical protein